MESGSQTDNPPERTSHRFANIIGMFIALVTLTLPFFVIAHFSSTSVEPWQAPTYPLNRSRD